MATALAAATCASAAAVVAATALRASHGDELLKVGTVCGGWETGRLGAEIGQKRRKGSVGSVAINADTYNL